MSDKNIPRMTCMEVWGGNEMTTRGFEFGGLQAWVYSRPYGESKRGGDIYYASSCATGRISRLLLADVAGHGSVVASTAADLRTLMRRFVNCLDQTEFVKLLNLQFKGLSKAGSFATAIVTTYFGPNRRLSICNAGHPRPLLYRAQKKEWQFLSFEEGASPFPIRNIPLGLMDVTEYEQFDVELQPDDLILSYTDALIESYDANGEMLGEDGLLRILRLMGEIEPGKLMEHLLAEIGDRYPENLSADDVTVLLMQVQKSQTAYSFREKMSSRMRFLASLIRGLNPRSERPPLPDANLANLGGAIIPALSKRWKGRATLTK